MVADETIFGGSSYRELQQILDGTEVVSNRLAVNEDEWGVDE